MFNKFHVSKKVNEALDAVRKTEFGRWDKQLGKVMKKKRFAILKRRKTLDETEKETINTLKEKNDTFYSAHLFKEQVLDIFDEKMERTVVARFGIWFDNVASSSISQFEPVVRTMKTYFFGNSKLLQTQSN